MTDHAHYETVRGSLLAFPGLLLVFLLELPAGLFDRRLAINAHLFDVSSDLVAFLVVIVGAWFSGYLDDRGREHQRVHREQVTIAYTNLLILIFGGMLVLQRSIVGFGSDSPDTALSDWWVIAGPALAAAIYWWVRRKVKNMAGHDLTVASLDAHLRGDVTISLMVFGLTLVSLVYQASWANSAGGLVMCGVLFYIAWELAGEIKRERFLI